MDNPKMTPHKAIKDITSPKGTHIKLKHHNQDIDIKPPILRNTNSIVKIRNMLLIFIDE
jgi:hypothetical protein